MWLFLMLASLALCCAALVGIVFPRAIRVSSRWHAVGYLVVGLVFVFVTNRNQQTTEPLETGVAVDVEPVEVVEDPAGPTLAAQWATRVASARLDETTINQFYAQMPPEEELAPTSEIPSRGRVRVRWTFDDGSYIEAEFRSVPGDMVLHHVRID